MGDDREFRYQHGWFIILFGSVGFSAGCIFLWHTAATNAHGLVINGLIELSPRGADIFYAVFSGFSAILVVAFLLVAWFNLTRNRVIVLSSRGITVPKSTYSSEHVVIPYASIQSLVRKDLYGQQMLEIRHCDGTTIISASMLRKGEFQEIEQDVRQGLKQCGPQVT